MLTPTRKTWILTLFTALFITILLFISIITGLSTSWSNSTYHRTSNAVSPPTFGYYIYGGAGDKEQVMRLLLAVYHPRNRYLLHLAADASVEERAWLVDAVGSVPEVREFGNVDVVGKPMWLTGMGITHVVATLRAAAILLRLDGGWVWFISLSAYDYPLLTQDGGRQKYRKKLQQNLPVISFLKNKSASSTRHLNCFLKNRSKTAHC